MDKKPWYKSKTIIGIIVILLGAAIGIAKQFGIELPFLAEGNLEQVAATILTVIGSIVAWIGRLKADKRIG